MRPEHMQGEVMRLESYLEPLDDRKARLHTQRGEALIAVANVMRRFAELGGAKGPPGKVGRVHACCRSVPMLVWPISSLTRPCRAVPC